MAWCAKKALRKYPRIQTMCMGKFLVSKAASPSTAIPTRPSHVSKGNRPRFPRRQSGVERHHVPNCIHVEYGPWAMMLHSLAPMSSQSFAAAPILL